MYTYVGFEIWYYSKISYFNLVTAIANYTQRVVSTSLSFTQRQQALMFIDHFLGDIGQPLHVEAFEVGGNDIDAICGGKKTNLHAVSFKKEKDRQHLDQTWYFLSFC